MPKSYIKLGLLVVAVMQIAAVFYLLRVYKDFTDNPENYYKDLLTDKAERTKQVPKNYKATQIHK